MRIYTLVKWLQSDVKLSLLNNTYGFGTFHAQLIPCYEPNVQHFIIPNLCMEMIDM